MGARYVTLTQKEAAFLDENSFCSDELVFEPFRDDLNRETKKYKFVTYLWELQALDSSREILRTR